MRYVMHAEVEPENNVGLVERLAIEVLGEVDDGVGCVVIVEGVGRARLRVVLNSRVEVVRGKALRVQQVARVLYKWVSIERYDQYGKVVLGS